MGSTSSKFKKNLQQGDEYAAMKIYQNSPEIRKYLDPNVSYGENIPDAQKHSSRPELLDGNLKRAADKSPPCTCVS
ncbi:hypothetical protein HUJ05_007254 [Dendroctonus ponderosae]|nr:hypothetical protein HUJ05_007254 [Dendroctonus ponderosae]